MAVNIVARARKVARLLESEAGDEKPEFAKSLAAAVTFIERRERISHPEGDTDKAGRFWLSEPKNRAIREPSRAYPWSQMLHGRTLVHCAYIHDADVASTRAVTALLDAAEHCGRWNPRQHNRAHAGTVVIELVVATRATRKKAVPPDDLADIRIAQGGAR